MEEPTPHELYVESLEKKIDVLKSQLSKKVERQVIKESVSPANEEIAKRLKYSDGKDYSNLDPTGIRNTGSTGCPMCLEEDNVTITDEADICHECGYVYT